MQQDQDNNTNTIGELTKLTKSITDLTKTVDDLAILTKQEFDVVGQKFDVISQKFETLEQKIDRRPTFAEIQSKLDAMEDRLREEITDKPLERDKTLDHKGNTIASKLHSRDMFSRDDVSEIEHISPFPVRQAS